MIEQYLTIHDIIFLGLISLYSFGILLYIEIRKPQHLQTEADRIELIVRRLKNEK